VKRLYQLAYLSGKQKTEIRLSRGPISVDRAFLTKGTLITTNTTTEPTPLHNKNNYYK